MNLIGNPSFRVRDYGDTFVSQGAGVHTANDWHVASGAGGRCAISFGDCQPYERYGGIEGYPSKYMRITWEVMPTSGETQYAPAFRYTFMEYHKLGRQVWEQSGRWYDVSWWSRVLGGSISIIPVIWQSYSVGDYKIFSGVPQPVYSIFAGKQWYMAKATQSIYVEPIPSGKVIDESHCYTGFGFDHTGPFGGAIDMTQLSVRPSRAWVADPIEVQQARSR